jgi:RNA polymerase sigma-70 factor, ECF subfamily
MSIHAEIPSPAICGRFRLLLGTFPKWNPICIICCAELGTGIPEGVALDHVREREAVGSESRYPNAIVDTDRAAVNQLFDSCMPRLQKTASHLFPIREDGEDALQDALLLGYRKLDQFSGRAQFSTWMYSILLNAARNLMRRRKARPQTSSLDRSDGQESDRSLEASLADSRFNPEEEFRAKESSLLASELLSALPRSYRPVVWLCDIRGLGMKETAERLRRPIGTVKSQHHRAHRLLRRGTLRRLASKHGYPSRPPVNRSTQGVGATFHRNGAASRWLKLVPNPVPRPLWGHSAYRILRRGSHWEKIRRNVLAASGQRCTFCGANGPGLRCQGIWKYDDLNSIATLARFDIFCPACATAGNFGRPIRYWSHDRALAQLCRVNGIGWAEAKILLKEATKAWKTRNEVNWHISVGPQLVNRYPALRVLLPEVAVPARPSVELPYRSSSSSAALFSSAAGAGSQVAAGAD